MIEIAFLFGFAMGALGIAMVSASARTRPVRPGDRVSPPATVDGPLPTVAPSAPGGPYRAAEAHPCPLCDATGHVSTRVAAAASKALELLLAIEVDQPTEDRVDVSPFGAPCDWCGRMGPVRHIETRTGRRGWICTTCVRVAARTLRQPVPSKVKS